MSPLRRQSKNPWGLGEWGPRLRGGRVPIGDFTAGRSAWGRASRGVAKLTRNGLLALGDAAEVAHAARSILAGLCAPRGAVQGSLNIRLIRARTQRSGRSVGSRGRCRLCVGNRKISGAWASGDRDCEGAESPSAILPRGVQLGDALRGGSRSSRGIESRDRDRLNIVRRCSPASAAIFSDGWGKRWGRMPFLTE